MTTDVFGSDLPSTDLAHHTSGGRNVVQGDPGHDGADVFHAAVRMSRMPMILTDPHQADNPIIFCNRAFERLTQYSESEVIGRNCRFLQGERTDPEAVARVRDAIARHEDVHEELYNYRRDGTGFWNALFVSPVFAPNGALLYFFASQLDVTRRHEAEAVLQQAARLETLGAMASGVAHEFNNLMTVVIGSLAQVERTLPEGSRERNRLDRAMWGAHQAGKLTQQILTFARRQFHDVRDVELGAVIGGVDGIIRQVVGDGVTLAFELSPTPVPASLDAGQLEMALLNLARNAGDAMPGGGVLTVRTRHLPEQRRSEVEVADTGTGMSEETRLRAIEPFYTTKASGAGTGLGLSMVAGFVGQAGGELRIESAPGAGTTIVLGFPDGTAPPPALPRPDATAG